MKRHLLMIVVSSLAIIRADSGDLIKFPSPQAHASAQMIQAGPFKGIEPAKLDYETGAMILAANFDYLRVRDGDDPVFAVTDGLPLNDGGTMIYKGRGYTIIRMQSITTIGKLSGTTLGVRLIFENASNNDEFAETRFLKGNW